MPFDPIIQAGSIPQVTQDVNINPYGILGDDVTNLVSATSVVTFGTEFQSLVNVLNPSFNYAVYNFAPEEAYRIATSAGGPTNAIITFDLGRKLQMRAVSVFWGWDDSTTVGAGTLAFAVSSDGTNFTTVQTFALAAGATAQHTTFTTTDRELRYLRVTFTTAGAGAGRNFNIYTTQWKISNIQKYY